MFIFGYGDNGRVDWLAQIFFGHMLQEDGKLG